MTTLAIARHAKSDWDHPALSDHDRPLNERGRRDAPRMARRLAERGWHPTVILTSTAVRARTTAAVYAAVLDVPLIELAELYGASARTLFDVAAASGAADVMLVAHDPGLSMLARHFATDIVSMPTCAVATFSWPAGTPWSVAEHTPPDSHTFAIPREQ